VVPNGVVAEPITVPPPAWNAAGEGGDDLVAGGVVRGDGVDAVAEPGGGQVGAHRAAIWPLVNDAAPDVGGEPARVTSSAPGVRDDQQLLGLDEQVRTPSAVAEFTSPTTTSTLSLCSTFCTAGTPVCGRLALVGEHRLHGVVAELAAVALQPELPAALHVGAERGVDAGLRDDQADLDRAAALATASTAAATAAAVPADAASAGREHGQGRGGAEQPEQAPSGDQGVFGHLVLCSSSNGLQMRRIDGTVSTVDLAVNNPW
jgi:hypothetical protein